jgi:Uma2 family endonuclease
MTATCTIVDINYPDSDGLPMAESDAARDYLIYGVEALSTHFQERSDVYVSGNLFIYYEQGNPKAVVAPDVFVVFDVEKRKRRSYKLWEENYKVPDFILEITSSSTATEDSGSKKELYARLGVREYFQYDPTADYLVPALQGFCLRQGDYLTIPTDGSGIFSQVLGLELRLVENGSLRFYDPVSQELLLSPQENALAKQMAQERSLRLADRLRALGIDPDFI